MCSILIYMGEGRRGALARRCISCDARTFEDYKQLREQQILNELLKKLDLPAKPNITADLDSPLIPMLGHNNSQVQALIEQTLRERRKQRVKKSVTSRKGGLEGTSGEGINYFPALYETNPEVAQQTSYVLAEQSMFEEDGSESAFFTLSPILQRKYISKIILNILIHPIQFVRIPITVNIFQRFLNGSIGDLIATKVDYTPASRQQFVQVHLDPFQKLFQPADENLSFGLYIQILENESGEVIDVLSGGGKKPSMYLKLETYDSRAGRNRRSRNMCRPNTNQTGCCLYDLVIDFEKVGWEFVIAPKRYNAYICSGECDLDQMAKSPLGRVAIHSKMDHFLCCHPKEYTGITIVYVDEEDQIWIREVPNMVARKCGCT